MDEQGWGSGLYDFTRSITFSSSLLDCVLVDTVFDKRQRYSTRKRKKEKRNRKYSRRLRKEEKEEGESKK